MLCYLREIFYFIYGHHRSIIQQYVFESWLKFSLELAFVSLKTIVALCSCPGSEQTDIEFIDVRSQSLVDSLYQLVEIAFVSQVVEGGQAGSLSLEE